MQESQPPSRLSSLKLIAESPEDEEVEDEEENINEDEDFIANDSNTGTCKTPNRTTGNLQKSSSMQQSDKQPTLPRAPPLVQVLSPGAVTPTNQFIPSVVVGNDDGDMQLSDDLPRHSNQPTNDSLLKQISILTNQVSQHYL